MKPAPVIREAEKEIKNMQLKELNENPGVRAI
jgi:hypothetical protein